MSQLDVQYEDECIDMRILPADRRFADALSIFSDRVSIIEFGIGVMIIVATLLGIATPITSFATCIERYSCGVTCLNWSLMVSTYRSPVGKYALLFILSIWIATWYQVFIICSSVQHWSTRKSILLMQLRFIASVVCAWVMCIVAGSVLILVIRSTSWEARLAFDKYKETW